MLIKIRYEDDLLKHAGLEEIKNSIAVRARLVTDVTPLHQGGRSCMAELFEGSEPVKVLMDMETWLSEPLCAGDRVMINGEVRTSYEKCRKKIPILQIYAKNITLLKGMEEEENQVYLEGMIIDIPLLVRKADGEERYEYWLNVKSGTERYYVPCAMGAGALREGQKPERDEMYSVTGRIKPKKYRKRLGKTRFEEDTVYEVEVLSLRSLKNTAQLSPV